MVGEVRAAASESSHGPCSREPEVGGPDQRAVVVLTYYRDLSVPQVATTLGVSEGTVKSRLHYAREAMRAALEADERGATLQGRTA